MTAALVAAASCSSGVKKTPHGVRVAAADGTKVRVEVVTDDIIHVEAVPESAKFPAKQSLMVVPQEYVAKYEVVKGDDAVEIRTASLTVTVSKDDGRVHYADRDGNPVTAELTREFTPIEVDGDKAWTVRQTFDSPADEAFYGLGQHQADEWNYKGKNEELYQYNTKISVPFIVSSRNYGILWDSYSFLRWGDPRDYAHLGEVFTLYDKDGEEGALTGTYVPMQLPSRPGMPARPQPGALVRREPAINQEYLITPECQKVENAPDFFFAGSNVTFEGEIQPKESGTFRFLLYYAGYTKVYVNDELVVPEIWRTAWNPNRHKFAFNL